MFFVLCSRLSSPNPDFFVSVFNHSVFFCCVLLVIPLNLNSVLSSLYYLPFSPSILKFLGFFMFFLIHSQCCAMLFIYLWMELSLFVFHPIESHVLYGCVSDEQCIFCRNLPAWFQFQILGTRLILNAFQWLLISWSDISYLCTYVQYVGQSSLRWSW